MRVLQQVGHLGFDPLGVGPVVSILAGDQLSLCLVDPHIACHVGAAVGLQPDHPQPLIHAFEFVEHWRILRRRGVVDDDQLQVGPRLFQDRPGGLEHIGPYGFEAGHDHRHQRPLRSGTWSGVGFPERGEPVERHFIAGTQVDRFQPAVGELPVEPPQPPLPASLVQVLADERTGRVHGEIGVEVGTHTATPPAEGLHLVIALLLEVQLGQQFGQPLGLGRRP